MKTPLLTIILVIALIVGGGLTFQKACKTGHHAWCVPESTWHHTTARAPAWPSCNAARRIAANIAKLPELLRGLR
jgi:hypothetical protein